MGISDGRQRRERGAKAPALLSDWPAALTDSVVREARSLASPRPWDEFRTRALAAGVAEDLAALGRELMRESIVRGWSEEAQIECGLLDEGEAMIDFAVGDPLGAERAWSRLLETDGRGEFP
jgi:hypothetical protein